MNKFLMATTFSVVYIIVYLKKRNFLLFLKRIPIYTVYTFIYPENK